MSRLDPLTATRLAAAHRRLVAWAEGLPASPEAVLALGSAVILHGVLEERGFLALNPLVDPAAVARLQSEHERFAEDLDLLESLAASEPASPDVGAFSEALATRLREHLRRDARLFHGAATRDVSRSVVEDTE